MLSDKKRRQAAQEVIDEMEERGFSRTQFAGLFQLVADRVLQEMGRSFNPTAWDDVAIEFIVDAIGSEEAIRLVREQSS